MLLQYTKRIILLLICLDRVKFNSYFRPDILTLLKLNIGQNGSGDNHYRKINFDQTGTVLSLRLFLIKEISFVLFSDVVI